MLVFVKVSPEDFLDSVLLPVIKCLLGVAPTKLVLVLLFLGWHGDPLVLPLFIEVGSIFLLLSAFLLLQGLQLVYLAIQVTLTLTEGLARCRLDNLVLVLLLSGLIPMFPLPELISL